MKRTLLQLACVGGFSFGVFAVVGWAASSEYPGTLITLATAAFLAAGIAFGKLEQRG